MQAESMVRVSCASLCRIQIDNQYLLMLNQNRRQKGIYQLSPIGGAITVDDWGVLQDLAFNCTPENPVSHDLRLFIVSQQLDQFREWFYKRQQRETSPFREVYEELVDESQALFDLKRQDVKIRFLHFREDSKQTLRKGMTGEFTQYFFEIFDVRFDALDIQFRLKAPPPSAGIVLLSEEEVRTQGSLQRYFDGVERTITIQAEYLFPPA